MTPPIPRRFTLFDAMVLIAATASALFLIRFLPWEAWRLSGKWSTAEIGLLGMTLDSVFSPLALTTAAGTVAAAIEAAATGSLPGVPTARDGRLHGHDRVRDVLRNRDPDQPHYQLLCSRPAVQA